MSKFFHFSLPLTDGTLMTTVRLTVGGITAAAGLDVDEGEDFKVCVTEALLIVKRNGFQEASVRFDFLVNGVSARILGNNFTQNTPMYIVSAFGNPDTYNSSDYSLCT